MKHQVWLSYDLSVAGDYRNLYEWLDNKDAKECGDSVAFLSFDHPDADPRNALRDELQRSVALDGKKDRIYALVSTTGKTRGSFIIGRRKSPPWAGYGMAAEQSEDVA